MTNKTALIDLLRETIDRDRFPLAGHSRPEGDPCTAGAAGAATRATATAETRPTVLAKWRRR